MATTTFSYPPLHLSHDLVHPSCMDPNSEGFERRGLERGRHIGQTQGFGGLGRFLEHGVDRHPKTGQDRLLKARGSLSVEILQRQAKRVQGRKDVAHS